VDQTPSTTITTDMDLSSIHELWASVIKSMAPLYGAVTMFLWKMECWLRMQTLSYACSQPTSQ